MYIPLFTWFILRKTAWQTIVFASLFSLLFYTYIALQTTPPETLPSELTLQWTATVKINGSTVRGIMKTDSGQKVYVTYTIQSEEEKNQLSREPLAMKTFAVAGELQAPDIPAHRYAFDMADYLKSQRALGIYTISKWQEIATPKTLLSIIHTQRFKISNAIDTHFPAALRAEAKALLIGDQEDVQEEHTRAYQKLGITHIFAISGLHVALVSLLFQRVLIRLHVRIETVNNILLVALPTYAIIAGGAPSVWRAVVIVLFFLITAKLPIKIPAESALVYCFLLFVALEPNFIFQIGFQLSFLATAAIIYSMRFLASMKSLLMKSFWITCSCQILVSPLLLYHFYELSLASFVMNLLFVPLFSYVVLPVNIVLILLVFTMKPVASLLFYLYEPLRYFIQLLIDFFQSIPYIMFTPGKPAEWLLILLTIAVLIWFYTLEKALFRSWSSALLAVLISIMIIAPTRHEELLITFLSVGQGDATLIEIPNRKAVYLVDAGGLLRFQGEAWKKPKRQYEVGRQVIVPYLKGRGITKIDRLILTHADADHVEGAEEVMEEIRIGEIHITPNAVGEPVMRDILAESRKQKIPIKEKMAGESWSINDVRFDYVMPYNMDYAGNNSSIVIVVTYRGQKLILPGDLEQEGEAELVQKNPASIAQSDVLKAGHHGSKTSTTEPFLNLVNPSLIIYSSGKDNRYGHPAEEVVERVDAKGIASYNTGDDGTIQLKISDRIQLVK